MIRHSSRGNIKGYVTKDGSHIAELMHPDQQGNIRQSLAQARVKPGETTFKHWHQLTEELYHILEGQGVLTLGEELLVVLAGDTVCIDPGVRHCIHNSGEQDLVFLCCCSPAYSHEDTWLVE